MQSLVVFNNKGGVGKTTLLCNLAAYLQIEQKKKVIVIDADPQCNATAYLFPYPDIESIYEKSEGTIYDVIRPVQRGRGYIKGKLPIVKSPYFEVDVIPGDPRLSLSEDFLSKDWGEGKLGESRGLQTTLIFKDLIIRLASYDYVIFDVGPSLGALNRAVLIASDFFLVPMSSDIFSLRAIENISLALLEWKEGITFGLAEYERKEQEKFTIGNKEVKWQLKFVGYVTQQYTAKTVVGVKIPVNAYEKIIRRIPAVVAKELISFNSESNISGDEYKIGDIPSLNSLIPLSQNSNTPIFCLKAKHGVVGAHFNKVKDYGAVVKSIVEGLLANLKASGK